MPFECAGPHARLLNGKTRFDPWEGHCASSRDRPFAEDAGPAPVGTVRQATRTTTSRRRAPPSILRVVLAICMLSAVAAVVVEIQVPRL